MTVKEERFNQKLEKKSRWGWERNLYVQNKFQKEDTKRPMEPGEIGNEVIVGRRRRGSSGDESKKKLRHR